jgi:hypothetical protein
MDVATNTWGGCFKKNKNPSALMSHLKAYENKHVQVRLNTCTVCGYLVHESGEVYCTLNGKFVAKNNLH